jgi:hypothetical protein
MTPRLMVGNYATVRTGDHWDGFVVQVTKVYEDGRYLAAGIGGAGWEGEYEFGEHELTYLPPAPRMSWRRFALVLVVVALVVVALVAGGAL